MEIVGSGSKHSMVIKILRLQPFWSHSTPNQSNTTNLYLIIQRSSQCCQISKSDGSSLRNLKCQHKSEFYVLEKYLGLLIRYFLTFWEVEVNSYYQSCKCNNELIHNSS